VLAADERMGMQATGRNPIGMEMDGGSI